MVERREKEQGGGKNGDAAAVDYGDVDMHGVDEGLLTPERWPCRLLLVEVPDLMAHRLHLDGGVPRALVLVVPRRYRHHPCAGSHRQHQLSCSI